MITQSDIAAGTGRLQAAKLKADDRETLAAVFGIYLKNLPGFSDLSNRLAAAEDNADGKTASKLAAILIQLEESGFDLSELRGGRSGLQTNEVGALDLKIRFGILLLKYKLPESFTGGIVNADETLMGNFVVFPTVSIDRKGGW